MKPKHFIITLLALLTSITASAYEWTDANGTVWSFKISGSEAVLEKGWNSVGISGTIPADLTVPSKVYISETAYNVTSIGQYMFYYCSSLTSITLPEGITGIGQYAFGGCSSLTSINIPDGVTSIGASAFQGCSSLTSITIPDGVTSIGARAFQGCSSLTSITIPDGVTSIGARAFQDCTSLTSINIPDGVTSIEESTFWQCSSLTSITLPNSVTSIALTAFENCSSLTSINIPDGVTSIGKSAFVNCYSLTSINIPDGVTSIEQETFRACTSLTSINIPAGVTSIGDRAFESCSSLTSVHFFSSSAPQYDYDAGWLYAILLVPDGAVDAYQAAWPEHATQIVPESSTLPYDITVTALADASAVIQEIGEENALKVVNLKVTGSINSYDVMVFRNKMLNLRNLDLSEATIVASDYTYYNNQYKTKDNVVTAYFGPSTLLSIILPNNITALDDCALNGCKWISSITIPNSVTSIGSNALANCSRLTSIIIPNSVISLGYGAIYNCTSLTSATIGNGVTSIAGYTFSRCYNLTSVTIPNGVTSIGDYAFEDCSVLTSIDLPKVLKTIGAYAFKNCASLSNIKMPPYVESMGNNAFNGCTQLNDITVYIPDYTLDVNENAFSTYTTATLKIPDFLFRKYYYNEGGWKRFINIVRCHLEPGDYETLPTNTDTSISGNDEIIPNISEGNPIDGEIFSEGSITVTDDVTETQEFDEVVQYLDGEGHGGSLIGEDDGSTAGNLRVNNLRVKINVKAGRWYFFCFPFDVTIANCTYPGQYAWRYYDGAYRATNGSGGWKAVSGATLNARPSQRSHTGDMIIEFSNPKFGGNRPKTLVAHTAANAANASWNLVGNPYSSFYDFLTADFNAPITVYNSNGTYSAYRPADDECHLQPFEAFFVQKPTEVDAINFQPARRESYNQSQTKITERHKARRRAGINPQRRLINLELLNGEEQMDRTRVVLNEEKSRDYELDCDAAKMLSNEAKAQLYSIENGINMAINERPVAGDIRLGYTTKEAGTLSISASRMDMPLILVDTKENCTFDLSLGSYEFETTAGTFNTRFMLRPGDVATAINNLTAKTGVCIGTQDGGIAIGGAEGKAIDVYTTGGALAASHTGNGFIALKSGMYVVSVDGVSAKVSVK